MQKLAVPISIVIAGALIAAALYFVNGNSAPALPADQGGGVPTKDIRGVQKDDHILGNPNAGIVFVEYSDTECPFCKQFHSTMHQVIDEYGSDGDVAWVYRHFPLAQLHPKAAKEAEALECAAELSGNDGFWKYTDRLYEITPSNNGLDLAQLPEIAEEVGLDRAKFVTCLDSGKYAKKIQNDFDEVTAAGGRGTPHSIVLIDGEQISVEGAQPFEVLKGMIEAVLAE
jgi:protein-disulfide isomerase